VSHFWKEIEGMQRELIERVREKVISFTKRICEERSQLFAEVARRHHLKMALTVSQLGSDPLGIVPCLYVFVDRSLDFEQQQELADQIRAELGDWVSDYRLAVQPVYQDVSEQIEYLLGLF